VALKCPPLMLSGNRVLKEFLCVTHYQTGSWRNQIYIYIWRYLDALLYNSNRARDFGSCCVFMGSSDHKKKVNVINVIVSYYDMIMILEYWRGSIATMVLISYFLYFMISYAIK